ncbi:MULTISPECIES: PadR family transcriptional regulator [Lacticaseibacillus]|uniref:PadR family transcriptional regulator n=2 Tax=Lacticaseibacillus TaxID=2759736 RepID=A0AAN1F072_LACCA|nr:MULTISPECIES: PadR family transcriptional regulator [Lacticaseibacillus]ARY92322.1 PadR family transcriptional regulator [Lacticaseibacillus casei]KAB1971370.1 PadR family transcriptional regulator [Lacticaseibacillus casei]WLV80226.1 PadR family transcriptional regulator [Lacticaseibacillus sp. NCIMB 15473]WNX24187.1 PadR family transcriptional regulator [Lacticaseibacillus casei]WNX26961.1 PadR family transcriptional regulator [Lacticaseibacillus casei]
MQPSSQMLKGILEGAILKIIQQGNIYGYALHEKLAALGFGDIPEGTIYPLLLKLQRNKLIIGVRRPTGNGPDRKYYHLTDEGEKTLTIFQQQWHQLVQAMANLNQGGESS